MNRKILFIGVHRPDRSPSQRFRFEQYIGYLNENGFLCKQMHLLNASDDKAYYKKGNYVSKIRILIKSVLKLISLLIKASQYDIIFVQREAFMLGTPFFERQLSKRSTIVFDLDDAIWINSVSNANKRLAFLKNAGKVNEILKVANVVFAGNKYLADYALQYNRNVKIIPTTIDTGIYKRIVQSKRKKICIGWSGSITTIQHFEYALPALLKIKEKYGERVCFKVIGDGNYNNRALDIQGIPWNKNTELEDLSEIDIGIMPLPNDEWAKGKCGLKGLQYMALEIATIMSPVGVNGEIIQDGINGFLADTVPEWVDKISILIEDADKRKFIGKNGRKTVEKNYSVTANQSLYLKYFKQLIPDSGF